LRRDILGLLHTHYARPHTEILTVLSPWRDLPERYGPSTTCCNRFRKRIYYRRIATRYDKLGSTFLPMTKLVCIRLRLRHNKYTA